MNSNILLDNDVNGAGANNGEGCLSGRCPMAQQHGLGCHPGNGHSMKIEQLWGASI